MMPEIGFPNPSFFGICVEFLGCTYFVFVFQVIADEELPPPPFYPQVLKNDWVDAKCKRDYLVLRIA